MCMTQETRFVTTPIYYVNDSPHIGHVYTSTMCDVYARAMRGAGHDVFFLTGTDEHGIKVEESAKKRGMTPQSLADETAAEFQAVMGMFSLTNDAFIRTTDPDHESQVKLLVSKLLDSDDVYLGNFEGWYDHGQEEYHTENSARELDYKSPVSGKRLVRATEKNYYFRLSAYQEKLEKLFSQHPDFVRPIGRRNEVLGRLREGLQDVPISRTNFSWGIPMPQDESHVIYVWIDALFNYITALGLGDDGGELQKQRKKYWPANYHVVGKEILWFHAVIWPAILMALDLQLPKCVYAHSFWIREGRKMSKSLDNFIDLETIEQYLEEYGMDAWRYYLVTQGPLGSTDADFASAKFHDIYNAHLVNTVGNCASRVTAMVEKYFDGVVPPESNNRIERSNTNWPAICEKAVESYSSAMESFSLQEAVESAMGIVRQIDVFINTTAPFKLAKDETKQTELGEILYKCIEALRIASILLHPVIPVKMDKLHKAINIKMPRGDVGSTLTWGGMKPGTKVRKIALFPRVELTHS